MMVAVVEVGCNGSGCSSEGGQWLVAIGVVAVVEGRGCVVVVIDGGNGSGW